GRQGTAGVWRTGTSQSAGEPLVSAAVTPPLALDVSALPTHAFGHRSVMWWATMCMIAIEGMAFALAITSYLYLKGRVPHWPAGVPTPDLFWGTTNVAILVASAWPTVPRTKN